MTSAEILAAAVAALKLAKDGIDIVQRIGSGQVPTEEDEEALAALKVVAEAEWQAELARKRAEADAG